jgi:hypothetical protein
MISRIVLALLQVYFLVMTFTVERVYCNEKLSPGDTRFLIQDTISFCELNNRLFLQRPDWMVSATCISSYLFPLGYGLTLFLTVTNSWRKFAVPTLLFVGAKMNAIGFYHYMEFTSSLPPQNLFAYFSVELPYIISMLLIIVNVSNSLRADGSDKLQKKH